MTEAFKERPMPTGEGLTFEKVWAMFQETDRKFQEDREHFKETERLIKENADRLNKEAAERHKEIERLIKEVSDAHKDTERTVKRTNKIFSNLGINDNDLGPLADKVVGRKIAKGFCVLFTLNLHFLTGAYKVYIQMSRRKTWTKEKGIRQRKKSGFSERFLRTEKP